MTPRRLLAVALVCAGCPGSLREPERFAGGTCILFTENLLRVTCAESGCHDAAGSEESNLDFTVDDLGPSLADVPANGDDCTGLLIDTASPACSTSSSPTAHHAVSECRWSATR
jgi:hypothetical protein